MEKVKVKVLKDTISHSRTGENISYKKDEITIIDKTLFASVRNMGIFKIVKSKK